MHGPARVDAEVVDAPDEEHRVGLLRADLGRGEHERKQVAETDELELLVEADVPVRDAREGKPGGAEAFESLDGAFERTEDDRGHECGRELRRIEIDLPGLEKDASALAAQIG